MKKLSVQEKYNIATFSNLQLNFWAIPKCGSTTIKTILLREDSPSLYNRCKNDPHTQQWAHGKCKYITPKQTKQKGFKNFAVLRDPIQRLYSMYKALDRLGENMQGSVHFKRDIKDFFKNPNVLDFVKLLGRHPDEERNIHFRSQKSYCIFDNIIKIDLSNISSTIHQIHPSLVVDINVNRSIIILPDTVAHTPEDIIDQIHQVFEEDFKLYKEIKQ